MTISMVAYGPRVIVCLARYGLKSPMAMGSWGALLGMEQKPYGPGVIGYFAWYGPKPYGPRVIGCTLWL